MILHNHFHRWIDCYMDLHTKFNLLKTYNQKQILLMKYILIPKFAPCSVTSYTNLLQMFSIVDYEVLGCHHLTAFQVHSSTRIKIGNSVNYCNKNILSSDYFFHCYWTVESCKLHKKTTKYNINRYTLK